MFEYKVAHNQRNNTPVNNNNTISFNTSPSVKELILRQHVEISGIQEIKEFWKWFASNKLLIINDMTMATSSTMRTLQKKLQKIRGELGFQIYTGRNGSQYSLVFCANSDPELRQIQELLLLYAPEPCDYFCYYASAPSYDRDPNGMIYYAKGQKLELKDIRWHVKYRKRRWCFDIKRVYLPNTVSFDRADQLAILFHLLDHLLGEDGVEMYIGKVSGRIRYVDPRIQSPGDDIVTTRELVAMISDLHKHQTEGNGYWQTRKIVKNNNLILKYHINASLKRLSNIFHNVHCWMVFKGNTPTCNYESVISDLRTRLNGTAAVSSWALIRKLGAVEFYIIDCPEHRQLVEDFKSEYETNYGFEINLEMTVDPQWNCKEQKLRHLTEKIDEIIVSKESGQDKLASTQIAGGKSSKTKANKRFSVNQCGVCKRTYFCSTTCPYHSNC